MSAKTEEPDVAKKEDDKVEANKVEAKLDPKPDAKPTKTVMIVEDNELNMKLFHDLLEAHGISTIQTKDGRNVLQLARDNKPDLILMDIQLPEVSGLDVTRWLKEDDDLKSIPVIAVTAFAMKGDEQKIREGGCEDYISKPISVTRFMETIQKYLEGKSSDKTAAKSADDADEVVSTKH